MSTRHLRLLLWSAAVMFAAAGALAVAAPVLWPARSPSETPPGALASEPRQSRQTVPQSLSSFHHVWEIDLRRPLYDPPPAPPPVRHVMKPPPLNIDLTGTVTEAGRSVAMFQTTEGLIEFKVVGDRAGGAEILQIHEESVTVRYGGETIVLKISKQAVE